MQKIISFILTVGVIFIINAQYMGLPKWKIVQVQNKPIQVNQIDIDILGEKLIPQLKEFEEQLTKKFGKQFDNCYRQVRFADENKSRIIVYLIPNHLDTKENWLKIKYKMNGANVYHINYMIKTKTFSEIIYRPILPTY